MKTKTFLLTLAISVLVAASSRAQLGFLFQPVSQSASVGADVLFLGTAFGFEPITYQWRKNGTPMVGQNLDFLYLANLQPGDAGDYDVVATTSFGSITSAVATLTIDTTFTKILTDPLVNQLGNSTGSAWGDFDNDGDFDVLVTHNGNDFNSLFGNNGDGTFTKLEAGPVTTDLAPSQGGTWADYDNDGWLDLLVFNSGGGGPFGGGAPIFLYHNNGDGTFFRVTAGIGSDVGNIQTAAWADYDGDGWLDLITAPLGFGGGSGGLYHNTAGTLTRVNSFGGSFGLFVAQSATWTDYDGDGDADLFLAVTRLGTFLPGNEELYRNEGAGVFSQITEGPIVSSGNNSTTASWADYDGDGDLDVFVGNASGEVKFLFRNNGDGTFVSELGEIAEEEGAAESSAWGDYDNDGWIDLFVANNMGTGNFLLHNNGDGTFSKVDVGSLTGDRANSVSAVWVDINNDGFLDLFVTNFGDNNFLYRNNGNSNAWLTVKCVGLASNRNAVGAKVRLLATVAGTARWQLREIAARDSSGSPNTLRAEFGLGDATNITTLRIEWPSGLVTELHDVTPRQFLTVTEPPSIVIDGGQTLEGDTGTHDLNFTVRLQAASTNVVSVDFATSNGTAIAGIDYVATNGTLYFAPGVTNLTLPVAVIGNLIDDTNRSFFVLLSNPTNMELTVRRAVGTILDDDPLTVAVDNPSVLEGNIGATNLVFTVSLNKPWDQPVSLDFGTVSGTGAVPGQDYVTTNGSLVFNPGEVSKPVPVAVFGDILNEANEVVFLNLNNIAGAIALRRQGNGAILNDDPLPYISVASATQFEGNFGTTQMVFNLTLSAPSGRSASCSFATTNGTAVFPADYRFQSGTASFPAGTTNSSIVVLVNGDPIPEGNEVFFLNLSDAVNAVLATNLVAGVILEDDVRLVRPTMSGTDVSFGFYGVANRQHRVEWAPSLTPSVQWTPLPGAESLTGNGSLIQVSDPEAANEPQRFYRVLLLP